MSLVFSADDAFIVGTADLVAADWVTANIAATDIGAAAIGAEGQ